MNHHACRWAPQELAQGDTSDQADNGEAAQDAASDGASGDFADCSEPEAPRNGIPTVTVFVNENGDAMNEASCQDGNYYGSFDELIQSWDHSTRSIGSVSITVPDGYVSEYGSSDAPEGKMPIDKERHDAIAELMDLDSAADYWWTQVFSRNKDGFLTASTYLYKPRGGKLCWGPIWDFDSTATAT